MPAGCSLSTAFVPVGVSVSSAQLHPVLVQSASSVVDTRHPISIVDLTCPTTPQVLSALGSTVVRQPVASLASAKPWWTVQLDVPGPGPIGDKQRFLLASSKNWDMVVAATPWVRP